MFYKKTIFGIGLGLLISGCASTGTSSQSAKTSNRVQYEIGKSTASGGLAAYVFVFVNDTDPSSISLNRKVAKSIPLLSKYVEHVHINTSTAAKWEKGMHEAFDRDVVPMINKYIGLPGFATIVDARSKRTVGCIYDLHSDDEVVSVIENFIVDMDGSAYLSNASYSGNGFLEEFQKIEFSYKTTTCPPAHNVDPSI